MLKKRIIPTLTYQNNGLVKTKNFQNPRFLGDPIQAIKVYNMRDVDEIFFADISNAYKRPNYELIKDIFQYAQMPVTIAGGINSIEDIKKLLGVGADKICISTAAYVDRLLIQKSVDLFGSQAIVVAVDYLIEEGKQFLLLNSGKEKVEIDIKQYILDLNSIGISEILMTCVSNEGLMIGYDLELIREIEEVSKSGIIVNGGASSYEDMLEAFSTTSVVGVAAASIFNFTELTPKGAAKFLKKHNIKVRT